MEGSVIANRYIINGVVGSGGMAIVYRGYDRDTGEEVAIKVLRSEFMQDEAYVRRFEKESQIAIKYSHKNIVRTIEVGCQDGRHYIVMEYVMGLTLKEYIAELGKLKPVEVVRIGRQICDALFYAHSHQLIHRDIKPQNILISREGSIKVADFGIAKAPETSTVTISGSNILGSVHYISPEQAKGEQTDEKADIYSMGIVLYEMVTGAVPFNGDTPVAVALKHLQELPRPPREVSPEIPKALEMVILKAIAKEPSVRYDNAREMARDLERSILEPEGNYIHIKQPEVSESARSIHIVRGDSGQVDVNHGESLRSSHRPKKVRVVKILLYALLAVALLATIYYAASTIIRSMAPKEVTVQNMVGLAEDVAKSHLESLGLQYEIEQANSDSVEAGIVIKQSPEKGKRLSPGDFVRLIISQGREQLDVPDVRDLSLDNAKAIIVKAGLMVGDVRVEQSDKPSDTVVRQDPEPHQKLPKDGKVSVWLAKPPQTATPSMPRVLWLAKSEATKQLVAQNIIVDRVVPKSSSQPEGTVIKQIPDEGVPVDANTNVELWVSNGVPSTFQKEYNEKFEVKIAGTAVKIVFVDGADSLYVYDQALDAGQYDLNVKLESMTLGQKTVAIYFNGKEEKSATVVFVAEDAR